MAAAARGLISLVNVGYNNKFSVNDNVLVELMHRQELLDRPLVIISIAGAFRSGKSFIMNFFIRYLRQHGWENPEWFGTDSTEISPIFLWKKGSKACTKGIHIFPEAFHVPLNDGRTAAVLLVDTQGLYDGDTSPDLNAKIMSVSTLFCSHQILNISHQVDERDLEHLELCTEFAKIAADLRGDKPFQSLTFLIRDWEREFEYALGENTDGYLREFLRRPSQSKEVAEIRKYISSAFEELCCSREKIPRFENGTLTNKAMDEEFQLFTKILVERILHPNNIVVKKCKDGREATADDLLHLICAISKAYKSGKVPTAETMLKSKVRANHTSSLGQAVLHYKGIMKELSVGLMAETSLLVCHGSALKEAETRFRELATMGDEEEMEDFFQHLQRECGHAFVTIRERNEERKPSQLSTAYFVKRENKERELRRVLESSIDDIASAYKDSLQQMTSNPEHSVAFASRVQSTCIIGQTMEKKIVMQASAAHSSELDEMIQKVKKVMTRATSQANFVGSEGGKIDLMGCQVKFSSHPFDRETPVCVSVRATYEDFGDDYKVISPEFWCSTLGVPFAGRATISLPLHIMVLNGQVRIQNRNSEQAEWTDFETSVDFQNRVVKFDVSQFSWFRAIFDTHRPSWKILIRNYLFFKPKSPKVYVVTCIASPTVEEACLKILQENGYRNAFSPPDKVTLGWRKKMSYKVECDTQSKIEMVPDEKVVIRCKYFDKQLLHLKAFTLHPPPIGDKNEINVWYTISKPGMPKSGRTIEW